MSIHGLIVDDAPDVRRPLSAINSAHDQGWSLAVDSAANPVPPRRFIPDMVTAGSDGQRACRIVGDVGGRVAGMVQSRTPAARRYAHEVTVSIVHGLVAAKMALHLDGVDEPPRLLHGASRAVGGWAGVQLRSADGPRPGSLVSGRAGCVDAGEVTR